MKKIVFQITAEDIDGDHIQNELKINCSSEEELVSVCDSICNALESNDTFRHYFHLSILPRLLKKSKEIVELEEMEESMPDFDEIVKNAKINPNKNIKEN